MNRIFWRFFVLVMLAITLASFAVYFAINRLFGDPLEEIALRQVSGQIFLLEQYIDKAPADEWLQRLNKVREVSNLKIDLIPLPQAQAALDASQRNALQRGAVVLDIAGKSFYRRVDLTDGKYAGSADDVLHASDLPIDVGVVLKMEALRYAIVALFLLLPIAFWSRSHWRGLQQLSKVADEFGQGHLTTRIRLSDSSSLHPLADCMNQMASRIDLLLKTHKNLLHSVSHELRTPIARLEFGLELLRKAPQAVQATRIAAMEEDILELNALVNELLDLTKLDQQHALKRQPFALDGMLQDCLHAMEHQLTGQDIQLELADDLGELNGDRRLLARAMGNLLSNAIKYGNGVVRLSAQRSGANRISMVVEDNGPGIPAAERSRIFEAFYRIDRSRDRATGGFGLGLAIVQKAIQLHGGSIVVDESALGGAKFIVVLG
ncbi:two-component sensor histidine kinase [Undibacterium sp. Jales W-56]|uniref:ATP-binding protein n=1 Tax=Undibacterium sp. Jales W-56 TaxID=2897325 RepID=UPI0021D3AA2C|nr:ATP-binding protein [Undibacterium sp. Jales W-56]MCU6432889.1 two-component sensor histidine kinase [Undibacterium sp. Jales W-56]